MTEHHSRTPDLASRLKALGLDDITIERWWSTPNPWLEGRLPKEVDDQDALSAAVSALEDGSYR